MKSLLLVLLSTTQLTICRHATAEEEPPVPQVRIELFVARLPETRAIELLPELRDATKCGAAQEKIVAMFAKKDAELVAWPIITTKTGQRAVSECVSDFRYPTQFDASMIPWPGPPTPSQPAPAPTTPEQETAAKKEKQTESQRSADASVTKAPSHIFAGQYEHQDLGVRFEVEPTVRADGITVEMQVAPSHVRFTGWAKAAPGTDSVDLFPAEQPTFHKTVTSTNITVTSGGSVLLGFHKLQDVPQEIEVFIVTTTVLKDGEPTGKNAPHNAEKKRQR